MIPSKAVEYRHPVVIIIAAIAAPFFYYLAIFAFGVNVPVGDDYAILKFMNDYHATSTLGEKLYLLFSLHNEHRIVSLRIFCLLIEQIFGSLDFRVLLLVGNAALLAALFQLGKGLKFGNDILKWAMLFLLGLQPQLEKLMFYPMASFQAFFGLLFAIMYLRYLLERSNILLPILFYILAVMTTGAGIFLAAIGVTLLAYQKRRAAFAVQLLVAVLVALLYFSGFSTDGDSRLVYLIQHPMQAASFFLQLLGNISSFPMLFPSAYPYLTWVVGALLAAYLLWVIVLIKSAETTEIRGSYIDQFVYALFLAMMIGLIVVGRTEIYKYELVIAAVDGRYRIYGILYAVIALVGILHLVRQRGNLGARSVTTVLILAVSFSICGFALRFDSMQGMALERKEAIRLYLNNSDPTLLPTWAMPRSRATAILEKAMSNGVYNPPYGLETSSGSVH